MDTKKSLLIRIMAAVSAGIIAVMPFHAFLSIWASRFVGHYTAVRLWKEGLLLLLLAGCIYLLVTQSSARRAVRGERLFWLIGLYVLLIGAVGLTALLAGGVSLKAYAYGALLDSRFLLFFGVTWLVTQYSDLIVRLWKHLLLIPAVITVGFASLQYAVLPADFLRHFGYGPDTIVPTASVDQKAEYRRIQSFLRGANPFGAYLVVVLSATGALLLKMTKAERKLGWALAVLYVLAGLALFVTYSRSAWIGVLVATVWLVWMTISSEIIRKNLLIASVAAVLFFAGVGYALRDNDHFQNLVFHTNEHSRATESSNQGHIRAMTGGLSDIIRHPWGDGTGTAGPASAYNHDLPRIAENYYVQIGQELGVIGLGLFVAINVVVFRRLWQGRGILLNQVLLASFIGLAVVNMLLHAWTDDTLAYIWWGLAGAALGAGISGAAKTTREAKKNVRRHEISS